jgi:putative hydrolase of the HAD superfamily
LHGLLDSFGISEFISRVFLSSEVGFQKPDPEIFRLLLNHFQISDPHLCLHIGDNYKKDYLPAKTLGMHAFLLTDSNPDVPSSNCIRCISDLNKL